MDRSLLPIVATVTGPKMPLVPRKGLLAIAAVIDVAIHANSRPVSAKALASRHQLPPRHLEPVLQALVRDGILKGIRGPHGGYELGRERDRITADDILRAAIARFLRSARNAIDVGDDGEDLALPDSLLLNRSCGRHWSRRNAHFPPRLAASISTIWSNALKC